jgi:hypothetical protein
MPEHRRKMVRGRHAERSNIVNCRVTFLKTKNGKKRTVPISEELERR